MQAKNADGNAISETDVIALLQKQCDVVGSAATWAKRRGLSRAYISDVLLGNRAPGPAILDALGLVKTVVVTYHKKELTDATSPQK